MKITAKNDKLIVLPIVEEESKQTGSIVLTEKKLGHIVKGSVVSIGMDIAEKAGIVIGQTVLYARGIGLDYNEFKIISIYDVLAIEEEVDND